MVQKDPYHHAIVTEMDRKSFDMLKQSNQQIPLHLLPLIISYLVLNRQSLL